MKRIAFCIFICAFLLFRPYQLQGSGMIYQGDDYSYLAHATSLAFGQFPSYEKEVFVKYNEGAKKPFHAIGAGLMAFPFVGVFSTIDRIIGSDIIEQRTEQNIPGSWTAFGFIFAANFYFLLGCFLLFKGLRYHLEEKYASLAIILMVLCQGVPLFAFRRPVFTHAFEFFLQSALVFILLKMMSDKFISLKSYKLPCFLGVVLGLVVLTRPGLVKEK